jgi:uncharacterized protein
MLRTSALTGLAFLTLSFSADAQSFDCKKNRKPDEMAICSDSTLSNLDQELAAIYGRLRVTLAPELATALRETQLNWLRSRRECGSDHRCLTALYRDRIANLNAQTSPQQLIEGSTPQPTPEPDSVATSNDADQDETQLILKVIANGLKCPVPASGWVSCDEMGGYKYVVNEYTGNASVFSVQSISTHIEFEMFGRRLRTETITRRAIPIAQIDDINTYLETTSEPSRAEFYDIHLNCRKHKNSRRTGIFAERDWCADDWSQVTCKVSHETGNVFEPCGTTQREMPKSQKNNNVAFYVCDKETASTLLEAIKALQSQRR